MILPKVHFTLKKKNYDLVNKAFFEVEMYQNNSLALVNNYLILSRKTANHLKGLHFFKKNWNISDTKKKLKTQVPPPHLEKNLQIQVKHPCTHSSLSEVTSIQFGAHYSWHFHYTHLLP